MRAKIIESDIRYKISETSFSGKVFAIFCMKDKLNFTIKDIVNCESDNENNVIYVRDLSGTTVPIKCNEIVSYIVRNKGGYRID